MNRVVRMFWIVREDLRSLCDLRIRRLPAMKMEREEAILKEL